MDTAERFGPDMEDAMSDEPEPKPTAPVEPGPAAPDEQLGEKGLKALQEERETRKSLEKQLADLKPLAEKWQEAEDARKSELERAREEKAEAEQAAAEARTDALRYRIANKHGISEDDAAVFLTASDEDGLEAQAARLAEIAEAKRETVRRQPDHSQGARPPAVDDPWQAGKERAKARFGTD